MSLAELEYVLDVRRELFCYVLDAIKGMTAQSPSIDEMIGAIANQKQGQLSLQDFYNRLPGDLDGSHNDPKIAAMVRSSFVTGIESRDIRKHLVRWKQDYERFNYAEAPVEDLLREAMAEESRLKSANALARARSYREEKASASTHPRTDKRDNPRWSARGMSTFASWSDLNEHDSKEIQACRSLCRRCGHAWRRGHQCPERETWDEKAAEKARLCNELDRAQASQKARDDGGSSEVERRSNKSDSGQKSSKEQKPKKTQKDLLAELRRRRESRSTQVNTASIEDSEDSRGYWTPKVRYHIDAMWHFAQALDLVERLEVRAAGIQADACKEMEPDDLEGWQTSLPHPEQQEVDGEAPVTSREAGEEVNYPSERDVR